MKKHGKRTPWPNNCACFNPLTVYLTYKSGPISCCTERWINVLKLHAAAVHPEQVVQVGTFCPSAEVQIQLRREAEVAGKTWSASCQWGKNGQVGTGGFGKGAVTWCLRQKVLLEDAINGSKQTWSQGEKPAYKLQCLWSVDKDSVLSGKSIKQSLCAQEPEPWLDVPYQLRDFKFSVRSQQLVQIRALQPTYRMAQIWIPIPSVLLSFCVTKHPTKATSEGSEAYRQHSMVSSFKPRSYCLSLKLNRQPLCTEIERLFR